ncbi:hypothetical protein Leryth_019543 [Lithospermum erythrorhizon]|nr:hypothetical protein Leryth_019543 [Lithospermum erythrorhizon]
MNHALLSFSCPIYWQHLDEGDDSSSWLSPNGVFAFGFRRPGDQDLFLLAIWFEKIPDKTIVWYANGDNPAGKESKIELTNDGQLKLTGSRGEVLWEAESSSNRPTHAALLDSGNFVLGNGNSSSYIWESFKHPADTILPTQVLEVGAVLSSRKSPTNYSRGKFQMRFLSNGDLVLNPIVLPSGLAYPSYYQSGTADDSNRVNSGIRVTFNDSGEIYINRRNGNATKLTSGSFVSTKDNYVRASIDFDGLFTLYAHPKAPNNGTWVYSWSSIWFVPEDICSSMVGDGGIGSWIGDEGSGACGFNAICTLDSAGRPACNCLPGFSYTDTNNKYSDCKQEKVQRCDPGVSNQDELYDMRELPNTYWPTSANYDRFPLTNEDDCRRSCLNDCNCLLTTMKEGNCWKKKMPISNGRVERDTYGKALVKVPRFDNSSKVSESTNSDKGPKDNSALNLVLAILLGSSVFLNFLLFLAIGFCLYFFIYKRNERKIVSSIMETSLRPFSYMELDEATDGFKEELGRGAFGTVYKGVVSSSYSTNIVAVKKLDRWAEETEKEFKTEATTIAKTHHKNLVRLLGFCDEDPHRLLVYEFMSNGTLASFLFGILRPDWNKRIQMAIGVARGLMYLHEECSTQIIHCDIKPQNILLDDSFTARISDFGLAKLLINDQTRTQTAIRGTKGYVAPEWFRSTPVTAKVDTYSYGVVLLEIICCRKNVELDVENEEEVILSDWVYDCYKQKKLEKLVETDEEARSDMKRVQRLVMIAIWCIQEDPSLRPFMKNVVQMLEGVIEVSSPPSPSPYSSFKGVGPYGSKKSV